MKMFAGLTGCSALLMHVLLLSFLFAVSLHGPRRASFVAIVAQISDLGIKVIHHNHLVNVLFGFIQQFQHFWTKFILFALLLLSFPVLKHLRRPKARSVAQLVAAGITGRLAIFYHPLDILGAFPVIRPDGTHWVFIPASFGKLFIKVLLPDCFVHVFFHTLQIFPHGFFVRLVKIFSLHNLGHTKLTAGWIVLIFFVIILIVLFIIFSIVVIPISVISIIFSFVSIVLFCVVFFFFVVVVFFTAILGQFGLILKRRVGC
mmetsp:Transcript_25764/g.70981  ORF Transcript_25764/g.70981 Transcript_25764/m.70981 type:complete len:260 (-) Transcript_25764:210-989(-)